MSISFENEIGTVVLPETTAVLLEPKKAREALDRNRAMRRSHLYPLFDATARFACSLLLAPQGCKPFELPSAPWIVSIGDDLHFAWGPQAFPELSLAAAIKAADHCVLITSGPDPYSYRIAATVAVRDRKNALIIESLPHRMAEWKVRIQDVRGSRELQTTYCIPIPTKGAA